MPLERTSPGYRDPPSAERPSQSLLLRQESVQGSRVQKKPRRRKTGFADHHRSCRLRSAGSDAEGGDPSWCRATLPPLFLGRPILLRDKLEGIVGLLVVPSR